MFFFWTTGAFRIIPRMIVKLPNLVWEEIRAPGYANSEATEERKPPTGLDQDLGTDFGEASYPELAEEKEKPFLHLKKKKLYSKLQYLE